MIQNHFYTINKINYQALLKRQAKKNYKILNFAPNLRNKMLHIPQYIEIYTESTPNPKTLKFVMNFYLLRNEILECNNLAEAKESPLAQELLNNEDIESVFISNNFVSLSKADQSDKEWFELGIEMKEFFKQYFKAGKLVVTENFVQQEQEKKGATNEENKAIIEKIEILLAKYVRPAVEGDGGNIAFHSYENGVVKVELQGACSGCPSSTMTLKDGIETLLKKMIPEVTEVIASNG